MRNKIFRNLCIIGQSIIFCFVMISIFSPSFCTAEERAGSKLIIGFPDVVSDDVDFFKQLVITICSKLEIETKILVLPTARSIKMLGAGELDAEGPRNESIERTYPDLIRVPEAFYTTKLCAFTSKPDIQLSGWESLKPYRVAYPNGWKIFQNNVTHYKNLETLDSHEALFKFLSNNRTDIVLVKKKIGLKLIKQENLSNIYIVEPPIAIKKQFLYLHKRNQNFASIIAQILREMKKDGTYQKMRATFDGN